MQFRRRMYERCLAHHGLQGALRSLPLVCPFQPESSLHIQHRPWTCSLHTQGNSMCSSNHMDQRDDRLVMSKAKVIKCKQEVW